MTTSEKTGRPSVRARHTGYVVSALINATLLILVDGRPGWAAVPFLTSETRLVLGVVDLCLAACGGLEGAYRWSRSLR